MTWVFLATISRKSTIPQNWDYTYAAWPGALLVRAVARLIDLADAWESGVRWKETIVLGGKRPLQQDKETTQAAIALMGRYYYPATSRPLGETELDMMRWLWANCMLPPGLQDTRVVFVDAPMKPPATPGGQPVRPNTEDTVQEWLKSKPVSTNILLSSGAPYGMAQGEALWRLLVVHGIGVETVGHAAPSSRSLHEGGSGNGVSDHSKSRLLVKTALFFLWKNRAFYFFVF